MPIDNEELMQQLQRVSVLARRSRRAKVKNRIDEQGGEAKKNSCAHKGHRHGRNAVAFMEPEGAHGYGNHKCHGGSGRHGQNRILAVLCLQEGVSQKDLAYLLGIRPQSMSEALDKLEESALIVRKKNEDDHRIVNVFLTDAGRGRASKVAEDRKAGADEIFAVLSDEEKQQFGIIMDKLLGSLEAQLEEK